MTVSSFVESFRQAVPGLRRSRGNRAPSPPGFPLIGHIPPGGGPRLDAMLKLAIELGPVVRLELPMVTAHLLAHPDHVERVLVKDNRLYSKRTRGYDKLRMFLGNGLVTSEGEFWRRQRRIAQPAFHKQRIAGFAKTFVRCTNELGDRWADDAKAGRAIDLHADMMELTLRIASLTLLSADPSERAGEIGQALDVMLHEAIARINNPLSLPPSIPTRRNVRAKQAMKTLDSIVLGIIDARRKGKAHEDDLLQMLLEARDEETGEGMTDAQLRDEVMTMFIAGHETTANALSWTFFLLSRFPHVARTLAAEASMVLGARDATAEDAALLEQSRRVISESMRLYPPVWIIGRSPLEDVRFDGYDVPEGSLVFVCPWVTHRLPEFWDDPEGFDPDRFSPERQKQMHRYQYFPFAAGPRMCIGSGFAMLEQQLVLSTLVRRFRLDLVPGQQVVPEPLITLRPKGGIAMHVHPRSS
jgi:cytochrome P450